jgi:hypothetical protein
MNEVECWYHYFLDRQACNNYAAYFFLAHIGSIRTKVWVSGWLLPPQDQIEELRAAVQKELNKLTLEVIASLTGWKFILESLSVAGL